MAEAIGLIDDIAPPSADRVPVDRRDDLEHLVAAHHASVTRLAHRLLGWRGEAHDVDDVVNDVFLAAFKAKDRFRGDATAWTWLAAITINRCRNLRRRKLLELRWLRQAMTGREAKASPAAIDSDETSQRVRQAVGQLTVRDREVIVLYYLEEMSVAEISRITGISAGAVDVRLHRARGRLRKLLEEFAEE